MTLSAAFKVARKRHFCLFRNFVSAKLLASVNKGKQRRPAAAKPRLPRPRLAAASLRSVALQTCPCGAGAVLWSFGAQCRGLWQGRRRRLPCWKARRITLAEVLGIALKTVVAPVHRCYRTFILQQPFSTSGFSTLF